MMNDESGGGEQGVTEAQREIRRAQGEALKRAFETLWRALGGPEMEREYEFQPERGWRIDYFNRETMTGIEVEGGTWLEGGGRHNRGGGYRDDCIKYNAATLAGIRLFRLTADMLTWRAGPEHLQSIIRFIREMMNA